MPPCKYPLAVDSDSSTSNPVQNLSSVLNELLIMQQQNNLGPFRLDTQIQLPNFVGKKNGEMVDSWICSLSTYFNTCPGLTEERKLQIFLAIRRTGTNLVGYRVREDHICDREWGCSKILYFATHQNLGFTFGSFQKSLQPTWVCAILMDQMAPSSTTPFTRIARLHRILL
jgi:hypothetical protein